MPRERYVIKSDKTADEIRALGEDPLTVKLALTLKGWELMLLLPEGTLLVVRSADDEYFIAEVTDVDEDRYEVTVEIR